MVSIIALCLPKVMVNFLPDIPVLKMGFESLILFEIFYDQSIRLSIIHVLFGTFSVDRYCHCRFSSDKLLLELGKDALQIRL